MRSIGSSTVLAAAMVASVALCVPSAWAQPGVTAPMASPLPKARPGAHRPAVATMLSLGATVGIVVAANAEAFDDEPAAAIAAVIVAPAAGRWYVGEIGVPGMLIRGFGVGVIAGSFGANDGHGVNEGSLILGTTLVIGGTIYDIVGAGRTASRQNQRRWAATPTVVAAARGDVAPGFAVSGWF